MLSVIAKVLTTWVQQIEGHFFCPQNWRKIKKALTQKGKIPLGKNENHEGDNKVPLPYKPIDQLSTQPDELGQLTLIGMREGTFHPLVLFELDFVSWIILEVKIDINRINLTPFHAHWVL